MFSEYLIDVNLMGLIFYGLFDDVGGSSHHIILMLELTVNSKIM
jgi:hypothetical protein